MGVADASGARVPQLRGIQSLASARPRAPSFLSRGNWLGAQPNPPTSRAPAQVHLRASSLHTTPAASAKAPAVHSTAPAKLLVVQPRHAAAADLEEARRLAASHAGTSSLPPFIQVGPRARFRPHRATFFGKGQLASVRACASLLGSDCVFVNASLSGSQHRGMEKALGLPVLDRTALIVAIFARRARTREARLQVALAALEVRASRLVRERGGSGGFGAGGATQVVSARERGGLGAVGGGGEREIELQRRRVREERSGLLARLEEVRRTRRVQREGRRRAGMPTLAVVGYTNAGKSSLVAALSKAPVEAEDRLFATLDPMLRRVRLPEGEEIILADTVGFISQLPTQLVEAFKATLEEVTEADLLIHVLDASSPDVMRQRAAVFQVLGELGLTPAQLSERTIEVWNKQDRLLEMPTPSRRTPGASDAVDVAVRAAAGRGEDREGGTGEDKGSEDKGDETGEDEGDEDGGDGADEASAGADAKVLQPIPRIPSAPALDLDDPFKPLAAVSTSVTSRWGLKALLLEIQSAVDKLNQRKPLPRNEF